MFFFLTPNPHAVGPWNGTLYFSAPDFVELAHKPNVTILGRSHPSDFSISFSGIFGTRCLCGVWWPQF